jgi:hypothetical protein
MTSKLSMFLKLGFGFKNLFECYGPQTKLISMYMFQNENSLRRFLSNLDKLHPYNYTRENPILKHA